MLAAPSQRQHISSFQPHHRLPSPAPSQLSFFDDLSQTSSTPPPSDYHGKPVQACFNAPPLLNTTFDANVGIPSPYMSDSLYLQSPAIRIQQSTPAPQSSSHTPSHGLDQDSHVVSWSGFDEGHGQFAANQALPTSGYSRRTATHQRATSASSIGSATSGSSYGYGQPAYSIGHPEQSPPLAGNKFEAYTADEATHPFSNNLPTPKHTPTQDSFMGQGYHHFNSPMRNLGPAMAAHAAMKQEMPDHPAAGEEDIPGFSHSSRHSVSSFGNSPATPHTVHGDIDLDDGLKVPTNGERFSERLETWMDAYLRFDEEADVIRPSVPSFDRTVSDAYKDDLFNTSHATLASQQGQFHRNQQELLSPYSKRQKLNELLQQANRNRSQSPSGLHGRPLSPFRPNSPYALQQTRFDASRRQLSQMAQMRQQQRMDADAMAAQQAQRQSDESQAPKTISPKDVQLDYHQTDEDAKMPLFPDGGSNDYAQPQYGGGEQYANPTPNTFNNTPGNNFNNVDANRSQQWMPGQQSAPAPPQSTFSFSPPSGAANLHALPFSAPQYRSTNSITSGPEPTPEFPAHLTRMESSVSEGGPDFSSGVSTRAGELKRPTSTLADSGTYSCTYHGCTHRFDTPQKLQRHKREAHRQQASASAPRSISPALGSSMSSAALLARNSQAGPHKCDRVNPTTGKPCNVVFSRPYDLTRHEDTIHNARKQKVRCALCVEEKTFSRNDALTRHMRVVHPEVDFPGKHRRRGAHE